MGCFSNEVIIDVVQESLLRINDLLVGPRNPQELPPFLILHFTDQFLDLFSSFVQTLLVEVADEVGDEVLFESLGAQKSVQEIDADCGVQLLALIETLLQHRAWEEELLEGNFLLLRVLSEVRGVKLEFVSAFLPADEVVPFLFVLLEEELQGSLQHELELLLVASVFAEALDFQVLVNEVLLPQNFEDEALASGHQVLCPALVDFIGVQELHYDFSHSLSFALFFLLLTGGVPLEGKVL